MSDCFHCDHSRLTVFQSEKFIRGEPVESPTAGRAIFGRAFSIPTTFRPRRKWGPRLRSRWCGNQIGDSKTNPWTQKSSDWESTNIGSKFISRTDPCLPGNPIAFAH
jgi:hypothetical protein